jgi:predicted SprT family Zn-dependent metalloprotease
MIATLGKTRPETEGTGLEFVELAQNYWEIAKAGELGAIGRIGFTSFVERGPAAVMVIEQLRPGTISWLAEAVRMCLDFAFDELKLGRVTVKAKPEQYSLLAALEDLGFVEKSRSDQGRKIRLQADRWSYISAMATTLMLEHIEDRAWSFGFDAGRRRAGLCSYTDKKITVSKYLSLVHSIDDVRQTVLHEIAHAMTGPKEGHGKKWLATAKKIGYRNEGYTGEAIAKEYAPYRGVCPNGHQHYRYKKPKTMYSCSICASGFNRQYMIDWEVRS